MCVCGITLFSAEYSLLNRDNMTRIRLCVTFDGDDPCQMIFWTMKSHYETEISIPVGRLKIVLELPVELPVNEKSHMNDDGNATLRTTYFLPWVR